MKTNFVWAAIFLLLAMMSTNLGCGQHTIRKARHAESLATDSMNKNIDDRIKNSYGGTDTANFDVYKIFVDKTKMSAEMRNVFLSDLIAKSDRIYGEWRDNLQTLFNAKSIVLGTTAIALSAAGSLTPTPLSNILSGASTAAQGADKLIDKVAFGEQSFHAIMNSIETVRIRKLTTIEIRKSEKIEEYSVADAYADAMAYHQLISLDDGINALSLTAAKKLADELNVYDAVVVAKAGDKVSEYKRAKADLAKAATNNAATEAKAAADIATAEAKTAAENATAAKTIADNAAKAMTAANEAADKAKTDDEKAAAAKAVEKAKDALGKATAAKTAAEKTAADKAAEAKTATDKAFTEAKAACDKAEAAKKAADKDADDAKAAAGIK